MAVRQCRHAELLGDPRRKAGADRTVGVAHRIGELHLLAPVEHRPGVSDDLRVEAVRHIVAMGRDVEAAQLIRRIDLSEDRVEVEVVEVIRAAIDLPQQLRPSDDLIKAAHAETGEDFAHFLGDEGHEVDDLFRRAGELGAQAFVLHAHAHRAGVAVALAHHDAAHRHQRQRADAIFLRAQDRRDHDVAPGLEAAVGAQLHPVAQAVQRQHLIGFGQAHFPRETGELDAGVRGRAGAADIAGNEDDVGMRLRHARRHSADARLADELHAHAGAGVDLLQVVDELRQILDRVDVMMRRRGNQRHAGRRMAQAGDEFRHLEAGKLAALAGLGALRDLDLHLLARAEIFGGDAETARCDLLDVGIGVVAIFIGGVALAVLAALARHGLGADAVHRDGERFMRLGRERAQGHARRHEPLADFGNRLDLVDRHRLVRIVEFEQVAQIDGLQIAHAARKLQIGRITVGLHRRLEEVHQLRRIGMFLAAIALAVEAADRQARDGAVIGRLMLEARAVMQRGIALARNLRRHAGEKIVHQCAGKAHRLEIIAAAIAADDRDAHLGHDLQQALVDRDAKPLDAGVEVEIPEQSPRMAVRYRGFGQIGVHRGRADADQHREIMGIEAFSRPHVDRRIGTQALADEMRVHRRRRQHHRDAQAILADRLVGKEHLALPGANRLLRLVADAGDGGAQPLLPAVRRIGAVDLRHGPAEIALQPHPVGRGQHRRVQHQHMLVLRPFLQYVGEVGETRVEAHHMPLAQGVNRRVRDLAEILAEEMADSARLVGNDRERRVVPHGADRFLRILDHGGKDQLHILQRHIGRDLATGQLGAVIDRTPILFGRRQAVHRAEAFHQFAIGTLRRDPVLDLAVVVDDAFVQIDREHLARTHAALVHHGRFRHDHHPGLGPDDQQIVVGPGEAQRTQRVAVDARDDPAAIGHRQRGGAVPRLHHRSEIFIHVEMRARDVLSTLPCLGHQHQLGGRRIAARAADRLEHGVERGGIGRARRDHRLDVLRPFAKGQRGHLDLVALHPVLVAANGVDLAIMGKRAERLGQPPLREGVGRIALVEDRDAAFEALVLKVRVKDRQRFREEQPLVDDRAAGQRADIEIVDLRGDHLLFDAAADQVEFLLELRHVHFLGHRPGDHDLLDFRAGRLRLGTDDRHVDGHLAPAIDGIARLDDLAFDDGAAGFLRIEVGAGQEHHADREAVGQRLVAGNGDRVVEEAHRQVHMDARAVAGLAVGIDRAAMPHRLQRVNRRHHDPARGLAVGRRDEADAAGIGFQIRAIHAVARDPFPLFDAGHEAHLPGHCSVPSSLFSSTKPIFSDRSARSFSFTPNSAARRLRSAFDRSENLRGGGSASAAFFAFCAISGICRIISGINACISPMISGSMKMLIDWPAYLPPVGVEKKAFRSASSAALNLRA